MITLRPATGADAELIHDAARATWEPTYREIISQEQIETMFDELLSVQAIIRQIANAEGAYVLAMDGDVVLGFAYFSQADHDNGRFKLHRLYVRPATQRAGIGKRLLEWVEHHVFARGARELVLNVNRYNSAVTFYERLGYEIIDKVDIPYREFWLNDYVMRKKKGET